MLERLGAAERLEARAATLETGTMDFTHSDEQRQELVAGISVGVVGGGTMGVGIAHRFAVRGATVRLVDLDFEAAEAAVSRVVVTLDTAAHRERPY